MTALAQGADGLALVMGFALLRTRQISGAALLLLVQSAASAVSALALNRPLMAVPAVVLGGGIWLISRRPTLFTILGGTPLPGAGSAPIGGAKLGIGVGVVLAVLCQSQGDLALPLSILMLSILLAATRSHLWMHLMAVVALQNGITLATCVAGQPTSLLEALLQPLGCLMLPLLPMACLLTPWPLNMPKSWSARAWSGWVDLALAAAIFLGSLIVPLDSLGAVFAPLFGLDGMVKAEVRRNRYSLSLARRGAALLQTGLIMMAVGAPNLQVAWLALLGAMALALFPTASRRQTIVILGSLAAGIGLFGIVLLSTANAGAAQSVVGYFSLFGGFALIAAVTPDIAPVLVVLLLRVVIRTPWPPSANALAIAVALIALLTCCLHLIKITRTNQTTLLLLGQASIAALTICLGPEGRFAGLVLLILLILTRSAARVTDGPAAALATAGLGGIQPLGVFPGLVLVLLAVSADDPWLLPPLGAALVPIGLASAARRIADFLPRAGVPSLAWVPLVLAVLAGYFTPHGLIEWLRMLTAGPA